MEEVKACIGIVLMQGQGNVPGVLRPLKCACEDRCHKQCYVVEA